MDKRRRVVTGQNTERKSVVVSDILVEPIDVSILPGYQFHRLWGSDSPPTLPWDGSPPDQPKYFPPAGGYRFGFFTVGPASMAVRGDFDLVAGIEEFRQRLPGMIEHLEPDQPGMHTTDTVDLDLVLSGEVWLELDEGESVHLVAGDTVVQNGTRHAWRNQTEDPCTIFVALLGAERTTD